MTKLVSGEKQMNKHDYRVQSVIEWMDNQIAHAKSSVRDLEQSRGRFLNFFEENKNHNTIVSSIGWFVNDIQNIVRNYRLDIAPDYAVRLSQYLSEQKNKK